MQVTLTNLGAVAVPFSSSQDKGFSTLLEPDEPLEFDSEATTVANVGDNPDFVEELTEGVKAFVEGLAKLVTFWRDHARASDALGAAEVRVQIENRGTNGLRVLLGSNVNEVTVPPGEAFEATAAEYVEIRELGV